jgi:hypothetical protein
MFIQYLTTVQQQKHHSKKLNSFAWGSGYSRKFKQKKLNAQLLF